MESATQVSYEQWERQARAAGQSGDWATARAAWQRALEALPAGSPERDLVRARIRNIELQLGPSSSEVWKRRFYKLGPVGALLWKGKAAALLLAGKGKLLLIGLTKLNTVLSMLVSLGAYCYLYGWKFALGLVLSIYVHEMGHVYWLRRYGISATAPMFIPGFGAFIRLKAYPASVAEDARTGLAGPMWGLGAALFAWGAGLLTGSAIWFAIAQVGAWINLFNLIPVWQLDGGRGFRALTRTQRMYALAVAVTMWAITGEGMLLLIALGALYRMFSKDYPRQADSGVLLQYAGLVAALSLLALKAV